MPHASHRLIVAAPYERVLDLMLDRIERPRKYIGTIQTSKIVERSEGAIIREMREPSPGGMVIREKISRRQEPSGEVFVHDLLDNARYSGASQCILRRIDGRVDQCELEFKVDWSPHEGGEGTTDSAAAHHLLSMEMNHFKALAENVPAVPDFVRAFYVAVDSLQPEAMTPLLADNIRFRIASQSDIVGRERVVELNRAVMSGWQSIKHHFVNVYNDCGKVFVECFVEYTLKDGSEYILPFLSVFEREGGKISNIKVFGDLSPLRYGWH
jgi:limonene-1,2-epoxide hydrolase